MFRVIIVYAPDVKILKDAATELKKQFPGKVFAVGIKPAATTTVPELAAADLIIFAAGKSLGTDLGEDYAELRRALVGINLAGRACGLLSTPDQTPAGKFRQILKDSEIRIFRQPLVVASPLDKAGLKIWVQDIILFFKEGCYE